MLWHFRRSQSGVQSQHLLKLSLLCLCLQPRSRPHRLTWPPLGVLGLFHLCDFVPSWNAFPSLLSLKNLVFILSLKPRPNITSVETFQDSLSRENVSSAWPTVPVCVRWPSPCASVCVPGSSNRVWMVIQTCLSHNSCGVECTFLEWMADYLPV